jgi:hypothetical protein
MTTTHTFTCAACGAEAATVTYGAAGELLPVGDAIEAEDNSPVMLPYPRIRIAKGPAPVTITPVQDAPGVIRALEQGDAAALYARDPEYASFWCPECRACYCARHWVTETNFDEGFFDDIVGWCPQRHRRTLMD